MKKRYKFKLISFLLLFVLMSAVIYSAFCFKNNFPSVVTQYCDRVVVAKMSEMLNQTLSEALEHEDINDILNVQRDSDGNIVLITVDTEKVNLLKSRLTLYILQEISDKNRMQFGIPFGNVMGSYLLSGVGPEIPITVVPVGSAVSKTKSSFVSGGVNQTKYELYVEIIMCIEIVGPFTSEAREITGQLCIAETIIVGKSPGVIWGSDN